MKTTSNVIVLEQSTNSHTLEASGIIREDLDNNIINLTIMGNGIVTHGQHGTLVTESKFVTKFVQQEVNPVTRKLQAVFD